MVIERNTIWMRWDGQVMDGSEVRDGGGRECIE